MFVLYLLGMLSLSTSSLVSAALHSVREQDHLQDHAFAEGSAKYDSRTARLNNAEDNLHQHASDEGSAEELSDDCTACEEECKANGGTCSTPQERHGVVMESRFVTAKISECQSGSGRVMNGIEFAGGSLSSCKEVRCRPC